MMARAFTHIGISRPRGFRKPVRPTLDISHPLSRGLVGCWLLGDTATRAIDISQSANSAGFTGGSVPTGKSHHGGMSNLFASASSQYAALNNLAVSSFTVGGWVNRNSTGSPQTIIAQIDSGVQNATFYLRVGANAGFTTGGASYHEIAGPDPATGAWHHVMLTFDGANLTTWYDGALFATGSFSGPPDIPAAGGLAIGRLGASGNHYFDGYLEGIRAYSRALSISEIQTLYAEPYAGIYSAGIYNIVGATAAPGSFNPGWAYGATKTIGAIF